MPTYSAIGRYFYWGATGFVSIHDIWGAKEVPASRAPAYSNFNLALFSLDFHDTIIDTI